MDTTRIEKIEIDLFLEAIFKRYGYDFRNYAKASLKRRVLKFSRELGVKHISELLPKILYNKNIFDDFIFNMSVTVTEMFRDAHFFSGIREKVIPILKTYPFIKIWHAGCATGEEVYSMAIILKEEGLLDRCQIYATDFNTSSLEIAREGVYPIEKVKNFTRNYLSSGGRNSFSDYYVTDHDLAKFSDSLKKNITFSTHNLAMDGSFGEMNLIVCRNVLIYFNKELQNKVLNLFQESLGLKSFLCLGTKEALEFSNVEKKFEILLKKEKVYRKLAA